LFNEAGHSVQLYKKTMSVACLSILHKGTFPHRERLNLGSATGGGSGGTLPSLQDVHSTLLAQFPKSSDGSKIGKDGPNRTQYLYSDKPRDAAELLFKKFAQGRKPIPMKNGKGFVIKFANGDRVNFRPTSSSDGSPAIDVHISSQGNLYKIHFLENK